MQPDRPASSCGCGKILAPFAPIAALNSIPPPSTPRQIFLPSQLNTLARELLESAFAQVWIEGELGGISRPASGHLYFALKDAHAQIRCALFKPRSQWLRFRPVDGMQVLARGRISLYEPRGDYQLIVEHLEEAGEGALRRAFEQLKARLAAEGLFDSARKRPLPARIARIGVLSSPGGAAVHDVLTVLRRRFPLLQVELLPVPVQGPLAAAEIRRMLERADASQRYDVLLLTRGGGALEDLAAFNDEALARSIAACNTPVVSAIGHEIDFSISDFVADLRAATPSAAAELLSRDRTALQQTLQRLQRQGHASILRRLQHAWLRLDPLQHRLAAQQPLARLGRGRERLTSLQQRLERALQQYLNHCKARFAPMSLRLAAAHPRPRLLALEAASRHARERLQRSLGLHLNEQASRLLHLAHALETLSPLATLQRGYAILFDEQGRSLRSAAGLKPGEAIRARLPDAQLHLRLLRIEPQQSPGQ